MEGIILNGSLADIRVRSFFNGFLEQTSDTSLQEDELLDLWSNQELRLDFESVKLGRF
jgi:hypothetical protein